MPENSLLIHLIAPKDRSKWPPIWEYCYKFWENSKYKVKLWNDEEDINNILKEDNILFYKLLKTLPKVFKLDYVRYLILEKFGGAYFDMDVEVKLDFLPLLSQNKIYLIESSSQLGDETVQNSIMISSKENPKSNLFWESVKNYSKFKIASNQDICKDYFSLMPRGTNVRKLVGSIMLTEVYKVYNKEYNIELLSHLHFNSYPHEVKICVHHQTGEWDIT